MTKNNKPKNNSTNRIGSKRIEHSRNESYTIRESESKYRIDSNDATIEQIESLLGNTGGNKKNNDNK